jgi:hypothetical protein
MNSFFLVLFSVFMGATGQMILKMGADKLGSVFISRQDIIPDLIRIVTTPQVLIAFALSRLALYRVFRVPHLLA